MARSDLLVSLVKAGTAGDKRGFQTAAEAIIAEERQKHHGVLADRLTKAIQPNGNGAHSPTVVLAAESVHRGKDFIAEITPRRRCPRSDGGPAAILSSCVLKLASLQR